MNDAPILDPVGAQSVDENDTRNFAISGSDIEGDTLTFAAANLPTGSSFAPSTRIFNWTPDFDVSGVYDLHFIVTDDGTPSPFRSRSRTVS